MTKRSVTDADVAGKRVLVRVDFNVPLRDHAVADDTRIRAALPTVRWLLDHGAAVILATHLGRPKGTPNPEFSVEPVAEQLSVLLGRPVAAIDATVGPEAERASAALHRGDVLLLENTRFEPGEEANDPEFAAALARLADVFVNDAFGAAHRAHASTVGVAARLPAYAGLLLQREVTALGRLLTRPDRPFMAILGGAKVSDKLAVLDHLLPRVDALLVGGGMANTLLLAMGEAIGRSLAESQLVDHAKNVLAGARQRGVAVHLPADVVVATALDSNAGRVVTVDSVPADEAIFDIGPATVERFCAEMQRARTLFWNGPMGVFEHPPFDRGTRAIAACMAEADAYTVVGGGDSVAAIEAAGLGNSIDHISTGGGASLEFLEGRILPGIAAIPDT
jgi:phosphoglycerate kinase